MATLFRAACAAVVVLLLSAICGCQLGGKANPQLSRNVTFVLHGLDGAGPWYSGLIGGLRHGQEGEQVELVAWGAPLSVLPNLLFTPFHKAAESHLAQRITQWREVNPGGRITLVGHSAGCGVVLGSLGRLPTSVQVDNVVLLAPAVSENYDLAPALAHTAGTMHVFYSGSDQVLPSTFLTGTYEGAPGNSAGRGGFDSARALEPELQAHLQQHPHQREWNKLGCGGGHFGWRARPFVEQVLAPLVFADTVAAYPHLQTIAGQGAGTDSASPPRRAAANRPAAAASAAPPPSL